MRRHSHGEIPNSFLRKKARILACLDTPLEAYEDKSAKGSIDVGCRDLIALINSYDGLVTTSSCAGRVSVFAEGAKSATAAATDDDDDGSATTSRQGRAGRWLFVSHDRIKPSETVVPGLEMGLSVGALSQGGRLIKLAFEPLILHVLAATLRHAQALLTAAIKAGFRESGVLSLRECPVVAIRSKGLGMESVIGFVGVGEGGQEVYEGIVEEDMLGLLLGVVDGRFEQNEERKRRLGEEVRKAMEGHGWEDREERRVRKRQEGLRRKAELEREAVASDHETDDHEETDGHQESNGVQSSTVTLNG